MTEASVASCVLRDVTYRSYPSDRTVTVRCTVVPETGTAPADGYGTAKAEAVARKKALSEAVERLVACTPFALVARPPTTRAGRGTAPHPRSDGVRTVPDGCLVRRYRSLTGGSPQQVPMFWSSPWVAGQELRSADLTAQEARLSSTIGWAVSPSPAEALRGALFELTELLNYGAFLYRCLTGSAGHPSDDASRRRVRDHDDTVVQTVPIDFAVRTPTVLALSRRRGRLMPATGVGCASTTAEATARAMLELAQAETLWRSNTTAGPAERFFVRRFDRWPLLKRCVTLDFDLIPHDPPPGAAPCLSPLEELAARSIATWADSGAIDISGPGTEDTRLYFAHVVSHPQPLLGLVRAGIPVFDTGEVRKILDRSRRSRPSDRSPSERISQGGHPAGT
nr:YcaO-like family protein [Streptomyces sp. NBC_00857]